MAWLDPARRRFDSSIWWGLLGSMALVRAGHSEERDPYWQIRAGAENLDGMPLVRPDTWTWSGVGGDWYPNSPLWNVVLAVFHGLAGSWGVFVASAATILLLLALVHRVGVRLGARPLPGLLGLFGVFAGAFPMLNARATLFVQVLLLAAVLAALELADRAGTVRFPVLGAAVLALALVLSTLGNWVHLSFLVLGPGLAGVWAVVWLLTPAVGLGRRLALAGLGGAGWLAGVVLSPYGLTTGLARMDAVQQACRGLIVEWSSPLHPAAPRRTLFMVAVALLLAGATVYLLRRRWGSGRTVRDLAALGMIGIPSAVAGLVAIRFLGVSLLVLAPVAAAVATDLADRWRAGWSSPPTSPLRAKLRDYGSGRFWRVVLVATLVVVTPGTLLLAAEHGVPAEAAVAARLPVGCHLFSRPGTAAVVVLTRPDVPVWIDGRADFFGRDLMVRTYGYLEGSGSAPVPEGTSCVLLDQSGEDAGLLRRLQASPEWRRQAVDGPYELWLPTGAD